MATAMKIREVRDEDGHQAWNVLAQLSGKTYHVRCEIAGDGNWNRWHELLDAAAARALPDHIGVWSCTCPAAKYRDGPCKHVLAVVNETDTD